MKYVLTPTDNDILHYKKGSESKSHKYISRVLNKGKWVYIYAKNRMRGNKVTNKNVKPIGQFKSDPFGDKLQYSPTIKTETIDDRSTDKQGHRSSVSKVLTEPVDTRAYLAGTETWKNIAKKYGITDPGPDGTFDTKLNAGQNIGKEVVTNRTGLLSQYTPSYKTSPKPYNQTYTSKNVANRYSPTISTLNDGSTMSYQMHSTSNEGNGRTAVYNRYLPMNTRAESKDQRSPEEKEAIRKRTK
jgi:hypothetical protein